MEEYDVLLTEMAHRIRRLEDALYAVLLGYDDGESVKEFMSKSLPEGEDRWKNYYNHKRDIKNESA